MGGGEIEFWRGENKNLVEGEFFQVGGGGGEISMCPSGYITSARSGHFLCHRYIWYIYIYICIYLLICSVFLIQ